MKLVLKFKAWTGSEMVDVDSTRYWLGQNGCVYDMVNKTEHEWQIIQWSGLVDKNLEELYSGDIIEVVTHGFDSERFVAKIIGGGTVAFRLSNHRNLTYFGQSTNVCSDTRRLGNIYESPELVEKYFKGLKPELLLP